MNIISRLIALSALVVLSPVFIIIAVIIKSNSNGPVFFRQLRPGLNGRPFNILKFRTMAVPLRKYDDNSCDSLRMTSFGSKLRATSLDELPGLWNVVKGDMAFVGPRPLLMTYLPLYNERQATRHKVRPGITGWAQVNGRNAISWEQKFEYDAWYVENQSLFLDFKILLLTVRKVLVKEGISAEGHVTIEPFRGNKND
ncbi:sugar transferase [Vibrio breoganii]